MKEIVSHQKLFEKAYFIFKMTGPAMVRPANSDFWKAPLDSKTRTTTRTRFFQF